jgi:light-regulated signal transduction histidine kinase (bacteriophytochrome)
MTTENDTLKELVTKLQKANEELERFAYVASHDLKAPLRAISNLAGWIKEDIDSCSITAETQSHLKMMLSRVARMDKLLDDLLTYARVGKNKDSLELIEIDELIRSVVDVLTIKKFEIVIESEISSFIAERVPLEQVLMNLIGNSIKHHTKKSGTITIGIIDKQTKLEFTITDDGPGIPIKQQDEAFEMFKTLKPRDEVEGSGMGLALVKKIVESQGGKIEILPTKKGLSVRFTWIKEVATSV